LKRSLGLRREKKEEIQFDAPQNRYYENISANLGILQVILYLSLFAFVVLSFLRNTNLITYRNFYYFFKDLNASAETVDVLTTDSVTYQTSDQQSFAIYRKGLAVAGNDRVTVFTATGRQTVSESIQYRNPVAVGSGKYLLVYEMGGTQYSVYNSYTCIFTGKSDHPIRGADVSENGMYALLSSSDEYTSVVSLYSNGFSLLNRYNKTGYVMDVSIRRDGEQVAILTSSVSGALFQTSLEIFRPGKTEPMQTAELSRSMGLDCSFTDGGRVAVLCGDGLYFIRTNGDLSKAFDTEGYTVRNAVLDENGAALFLGTSVSSEKNNIIIFDKNGKMLYNESVEWNVEQMVRCENAVFGLNAHGIVRVVWSQRSRHCARGCREPTDRYTFLLYRSAYTFSGRRKGNFALLPAKGRISALFVIQKKT